MNDLINIYKLWNKKEKKWLKKGISGFNLIKSFKYLESKKLLMILSAPSNITTYFISGLELYKRNEFNGLTIAKYSSLYLFLQLLENGIKPTKIQYDSMFIRTKKGSTISKRRAYEFLQEQGVSDISEHSYFTRGKWCDSILKDIEGNEMMLAEILVNYEKYLENTEWRLILKEKEEEKNIEEKVEIKRTFLEWLNIE